MIERFNKTYREGVLDSYLFDDLDELRTIAEEWSKDYNQYRPHDGLGGLNPLAYKEKKNQGLRSATLNFVPDSLIKD